MKELLIHLRAMQMFSHSAHHLVSRIVFHSDHEFFGGLYSELSGDYDSVAERLIGLSGEEQMELSSILIGVATKLKGCPSIGVRENSEFYRYQLALEDQLNALISNLIKLGVSVGTEQMIGDIADRSESRKYKIKQRIKK